MVQIFMLKTNRGTD